VGPAHGGGAGAAGPGPRRVRRHLGEIDHALASGDWSASQQQRASRLVIEFGRRFYALQIEWIDWVADQVAAGTLQPGNLPPGVPATALSG